MRIITGTYRGRILKSPPNYKIRPTSDRLRETLFNVLNPKISGLTRFLDLCAGTGAIGIEAISRGARFATFVDISRKNCGLIETNLDLVGIPEEETEVICSPAEEFVKRAQEAQKQSWDIVYFDPPYENDYLYVLGKFGEEDSKLLNAGGLFIAEHSKRINLPDKTGKLRRWRILRQSDSYLSFYEKQ